MSYRFIFSIFNRYISKMVRYEDVKGCVQDMLNDNHIECVKKDKQKVVRFLVKYIDILIFNIIAICCIISLNIGIKKLTETHVIYMKKYFDKRCSLAKSKKMSGGTFNTASFYGVEERQYSAKNSIADIMNVNFEEGIARPELKGGNKCSKLNKVVSSKIKDVFKYFKVTVKKEVRDSINGIFNEYLNQLVIIMKKNKTELTENKLKTILGKSQMMKK